MKKNRYFRPFLIVISCLLFLGTAYAEIAPPKINYQGYLTSGYTGPAQVKVAIVSDEGKTTCWSNDGTSIEGSEPKDAIGINATDGLFNVVLGNTDIPNMKPLDKAIFGKGKKLYLRVWVKANTDVFEKLDQDEEIVSAPYALACDTVDIQNVKMGLSNDFHNIGGIDDDVPETDGKVPDNISINNGSIFAPAGFGRVGIAKTNPMTELDVNGTVTAKAFIGDGSKLAGISGGSKIYFAFGKDEISTTHYLFTTMPNMQITQTFPAGKIYIHFNAPVKPGVANKHFDPFVGLFIDGMLKCYSRIIEENPGASYRNITIDWVESIGSGNHTIEIKWLAGYYITPSDANPVIQIGDRCPRTLTVITGQ